MKYIHTNKNNLDRTNQVRIITFYYVTKSIIEDDGNVKEFVIKQIKINAFEIEYVSEKELTDSQIKKIEVAIELYLEPNLMNPS